MTIISQRRRRSVPDDEREFLERYDPHLFPPVAVAVDIAILTVRGLELAILLIRRAEHPYRDSLSLPGGFLRANEDVDQAAERELTEETGIRVAHLRAHLEPLRTYAAPERDPRMRVVSVAYLALIHDIALPRAGGDASSAQFWSIAELTRRQAPSLAFDHAAIINDGIERARSELEHTSVATSLLKEPFTLSDLRRTYEAVWGVKLEPANFRRKVLSTPGFVESTGERTSPTLRGRPAELYRSGGAVELHPPIMRPSSDERLLA